MHISVWANCRKCSAAKCSYWTHEQFMMFNVPLIARIKQFTSHIVSVEIKKIKTLLVLSVTLVSIVRCVSPVTRYNCTLLDLHLNVSHYRNTPVLTFRYIWVHSPYNFIIIIKWIQLNNMANNITLYSFFSVVIVVVAVANDNAESLSKPIF